MPFFSGSVPFHFFTPNQLAPLWHQPGTVSAGKNASFIFSIVEEIRKKWKTLVRKA
jgi:hypothetical protein